ncbi:MAG TPA: hypothetical protein VMB19_10415 [Silvibacterium sp.]|nr:hypothetical protein [Silvibacterium sp.]
MSVPFWSFDAIRQCEAETWRGFTGLARMMRTLWSRSKVGQSPLDPVARVIAEQMERTNDESAGNQWIQ